jgi:hypothetical protein
MRMPISGIRLSDWLHHGFVLLRVRQARSRPYRRRASAGTCSGQRGLRYAEIPMTLVTLASVGGALGATAQAAGCDMMRT